jgi:hypothetical protein
MNADWSGTPLTHKNNTHRSTQYLFTITLNMLMTNFPRSEDKHLVQIKKREDVPVYTMNIHEWAEVYRQSFLTPVTDGWWMINFTIWSLYHGENTPCTYSTAGWMSLKAILDALEEMCCPMKNRTKTARLSVCIPVTIPTELSREHSTQHYKAYTIPASIYLIIQKTKISEKVVWD